MLGFFFRKFLCIFLQFVYVLFFGDKDYLISTTFDFVVFLGLDVKRGLSNSSCTFSKVVPRVSGRVQ